MIGRLTRALIGISLIFSCFAQAQEADIYSRPLQIERSHDYDVLHYRVELEIAHATHSFAGKATITLRSLRSDVDSFALDAETFIVTGAQSANGKPLRFRQPPGQVVVYCEREYGYDDTLTFSVSYVADSVDVDEVRHGMSAGYDLGLSFKPATDRRSEIVNTLSFPTGARHWFPCYDHPNDKATSEVIATVDEKFDLLSNGTLLSIRHDSRNGRKTFHWYQSMPHSTYLTVMVAGEYAVVRDSLGPLPISYWVYRTEEQNARRTFGRTPEILSFYGDLFGVPFPWEKYDQITIPGIGGGAESTTATVIGESAVIDENAEQDFPAEWLVAHEGAHQWWGDYVTMRDWDQTWMNESFATYYEYVWSRHSYGDDEGAWNMESKRRQYYREADTRYRRPIVFSRWEYPNQNFDSHTYPKGAAVLHMLRAQLGNEEFDASIRHFLQSHPYGSVDTHDLLVAIREASGRVMDPFFDQWIYSAGHPELEVSWEWDDMMHEIVLRIRQVQERNEYVPVFSFPMDIGIKTELGYSVESVDIAGEDQTFRLKSDAKPEFIRWDEGNVLLARVQVGAPPEEILRVLARTDVVGRRKAIERLAEFLGRSDVRDALIATGERDPFWRVRGLALRTLGDARKGSASYFRERMRDTMSGVRAAAVYGLGMVGTDAAVPDLLSLFETESSYLVKAEIVKAVGRLDGAKRRGFLESAKQIRSQRSVIQRAAEEALKFLDNEQTY